MARIALIVQGDAPHLNTMLGDYQDVGAGMAKSGSRDYFTLLVGKGEGTGSASPPEEGQNDGGAGAGDTNEDPGASGTTFNPVLVATPNANGAVIHVVEPGQALYTIAVVYEVDLEEIMALNGITENSLIHPGDKIVIHPGEATPTPSPQAATPTEGAPTATPTETRTPTGTPRPSPTSSPTPQAEMVAQIVPTQSNPVSSPQGARAPGEFVDLARQMIIALMGAAAVLVMLGALRDRIREGSG